jgi:hypothetical protein
VSELLAAAQQDTPAQAAQAYLRLGLSVLPLNGKRPAIAWGAYQTRLPGEDEIADWTRRGLFKGVGIVCGAVSGNLVVLDLDGQEAYATFARRFRYLAETYTVCTGSGVGVHLYLRVDDLPAPLQALDTPIGHLELRSTGQQVAAPPSPHPTSKRLYQIMRPQPILRVGSLAHARAWIASYQAPSTPTAPPLRQEPPRKGAAINPALIQAIAETLRARGYRQRGVWLNGPCLYPERHRHDDQKVSFGFHLTTAYGHCFRCGSMLAREVAARLGLDPTAYGGLRRCARQDHPLT